MWYFNDLYTKAEQDVYLRTKYNEYVNGCWEVDEKPMSFKAWVEDNS